jgi:hypothetical protein
MSLAPIPTTLQIVDKGGALERSYQAWLASIQYYLAPVGTNGTTANRPVNASPQRPLYVGQSYFDSTLGKPIWVKSLNPTVWVDAAGTVV